MKCKKEKVDTKFTLSDKWHTDTIIWDTFLSFFVKF